MDEIKEENSVSGVENKLKYKIENFEGPLDLLLHLIKENKMDIKTVKLSEITGQFLEYIAQLQFIDMDKASEFVEMAATLIEIKSKSLLPKPEIVEPEEDTEAMLLRRLEEYRIFKEVSENLKPLENVDRFYKVPDSNVGEVKVIFNDFNLDNLITAFSRLLHRVEMKETVETPRNVTKDRFTVKEKIQNIREVLSDRKQIKFTELFDDDYSKIEVITTFMALLELLKMQKIKADQNKQFSEINIRINEEEFYKTDNIELQEAIDSYGEEE